MQTQPTVASMASHAEPTGGLLRIIWPFIASTLVLIGLAAFIFWLLSASRAYVDGESRWSKAQRDALLSLLRYHDSCDRQEFTSYREFLKVPKGDHDARVAMEAPRLDLARARTGFLQGDNHPDDIDGMIFVFRHFRWVPQIRDAVNDWRAADVILARLEGTAERLDADIRADCEQARRSTTWTEQLHRINTELFVVQASFSRNLGEANRLVFHLAVVIMVVAGLMLCALGTVLANRTVRANRDAHRRADEASRIKGEFLANMSHELRTPMNGVVGLIDALEQTPLNAEQRETVSLIRSSGRALLSVIDEVLDFSSMSSGQLQIEHVSFDIAMSVEQVCGVLDRAALDKSVDILIMLSPELPNPVMGDPLRFRQITFNLLSNAVKFSARPDRRGEVRVRLESAAGPQGAPGLTLSVIDDGVGLDASARSRLFQPFVQGDLSTTRRYGGTGLGLSICHKLVQAMGGTIEVESRAGEGARFTVWLPLSATAEGAPSTSTHATLQGLSCVVVGPSGGVARHLGLVLQAEGARVAAGDQPADVATELTAWKVRTATAGPLICMIDDPHNENRLDAWQEALALGSDTRVRLIQLGRGQRRRLRPRGRGLGYSQDASGLVRDQWLTSIRNLVQASAPVVDEPPQSSQTAETLPAVSASDHTATPAGERILVAEDNPANQKVIAFQLRKLGYSIDIADDGQQALKLFSDGRYDLLLTDLHMPNMDGFELTAVLREQRARRADGRRLPIVALTANTQSGEAERCRRSGFDDFLSKPTGLVPLGAVLRRWLDAKSSGAEDPSTVIRS